MTQYKVESDLVLFDVKDISGLGRTRVSSLLDSSILQMYISVFGYLYTRARGGRSCVFVIAGGGGYIYEMKGTKKCLDGEVRVGGVDGGV